MKIIKSDSWDTHQFNVRGLSNLHEFFVGLHQISHAQYFSTCMISVNRLRKRVSDFKVCRWLMDSGAFSELKNYGYYRRSVQEYAAQIKRWKHCGQLVAAVTRDWMCEKVMLDITGLTVREHQRRTITGYEELLSENTGVYILPVLQGYTAQDYLSHIKDYGNLIKEGAWVGIGSVCKRNGKPDEVVHILTEIMKIRPDIRLHGFGIKTTSLAHPKIRDLLFTADSLAWSFAARMQGRNQNDYHEAENFVHRISKYVGYNNQVFNITPRLQEVL